MSEIEVTDVEQAKILISMKNDEIKSLTNKMKMFEKKGNIKMAENSYQIQQLRNKIQDMEKNGEKLKEHHEVQLRKHIQCEDKLNKEITKMKETINDMIKNERQAERAHKAQLYEYQLTINQEKQQKIRYARQLKDLLKLFNPQQIMKQLHLKSYQEITPYLKVKEELKNKCEEVAVLQHQVEQFKTDTFHAMEESFSKLNSYEEVMESLREKNSQLESIMLEKQKTIEEKHSELQEKDSILAQVEAFTTEKYTEMSNEIDDLRKSLRTYERESMHYNQSKEENEKNLKFIFELTSDFERKEEDYLNKIMELEITFQTMEAQKQQLINEYNEHLSRWKEQEDNYQRGLERAQKNFKDKEEIIEMLTASLRELQGQYENTKAELEKSKLEASELIRRKHKLMEQLKEKDEFYQSKEESLLEEIELLRSYQNRKSNESSSDELPKVKQFVKSTPVSLEQELQPEPNWFQLYEACLQKHNRFIREVYFLLRKQERKQSANIEETGF